MACEANDVVALSSKHQQDESAERQCGESGPLRLSITVGFAALLLCRCLLRKPSLPLMFSLTLRHHPASQDASHLLGLAAMTFSKML
jgi:hypothetical protein